MADMEPEPEAELQGMTLKLLKRRARAIGVDEEAIEDADDEEDIKGAVIQLILAKQGGGDGAAAARPEPELAPAPEPEPEAAEPASEETAAESGADKAPGTPAPEPEPEPAGGADEESPAGALDLAEPAEDDEDDVAPPSPTMIGEPLSKAQKKKLTKKEKREAKEAEKRRRMMDKSLFYREKVQLIVFICGNVLVGTVGLVFAYSVYSLRFDNEGAATTPSHNSAVQLIWMIVLGLCVASISGIWGALKLKVGLLRFYAFLIMIIICAQLSILMCLVIDVDAGAATAAATSAAETLKLDTATSIREHYCHLESMSVTLSTTACEEMNAQLSADLQVDCAQAANSTEPTCTSSVCPLPPVVDCAVLGAGWLDGECGSCVPAKGVSDDTCIATYKNLQEARGWDTGNQADDCLPGCDFFDPKYSEAGNETDANATSIESLEEYATSIWEGDSLSAIFGSGGESSMCDCNPRQDTQQEQDAFLDCMKTYLYDNLIWVTLIVVVVIISEGAIAVLGWIVLRARSLRLAMGLAHARQTSEEAELAEGADKDLAEMEEEDIIGTKLVVAEVGIALLQSGFDRYSEEVGHLLNEQVIEVLEAKVNEQGILRVRCDQGWTNTKDETGHEMLRRATVVEAAEFIVNQEAKIVTETWYFEGTVIMAVLLSMYVLAMQSPTVPPPPDEVVTLRILEVFVTIFMTMELALEAIVMLSTRRVCRYMQNPWHWVDYVVLVTYWMFLFDPDPDNKFSAVCRALRVVRPMRSLRIFRPVKLIGESLRDDAGVFLDVTMFTLMLILIFSLVGVTMYHGSLQYTCGIPVIPGCEDDLSGSCTSNATFLPGNVIKLRTPRNASALENDDGRVTDRLLADGELVEFQTDDGPIYVGETFVELPTAELLLDVYPEEEAGSKSPLDGLPCPQTLTCGVVPAEDEEKGWWQDQETGLSRCFRLDPDDPRVLNEDSSGNRGFDNMGQGFVTFLILMGGDGGMEEVPTGLISAGAFSAYVSWGFFFVASLLLNFVTLNLLLAMCVSSLENVSSQFKQDEKDKVAAQKAKEQKAQAIADQRTSSNPLLSPISSILSPLDNADGLVEDLLDDVFEGLDDFDAARSEMEAKVEELDWTGSCFCCGPVRNLCKVFVMSSWYRNSVVLMILLWTLVLMTKTGTVSATGVTALVPGSWNQQETEQLFQYVEAGLLVGFILEIFIKWVGVGWSLFWRSQEALLDLLFLIVTCVGFATSYFAFFIEIGCQDDDGLPIVREDTQVPYASVQECVDESISDSTRRIFKMMRVAQIARMLYKHGSIYVVMQRIFKNWKAITGILMFVIFSMAMFAIVGMHLLGNGLGYGAADAAGLCCADDDGLTEASSPPGGYWRSNFETFWDAILSTIQIILGDGWSLIMTWYMNNGGLQGIFAATFFTVAFLWVFGVLFNLFVAVLLINFGVEEDDKMPLQKERFHTARIEREGARSPRSAHDIDAMLAKALKQDKEEDPEEQAAKKRDPLDDEFDLVKALEVDLNPKHKSLWLFKSTDPLRLKAAELETDPWFMRVMVGLIGCSMLVLALEDASRIEAWKTNVGILEVLVIIVFACELVLKTITSGFILKSGPSAPYLRVRRNQMDFLYLVAAVATMLPSVQTYLATNYALGYTHFRVIRGLGPIVGLQQSPGVRAVMANFYSCIPGVITVMVPILFVLIMFSLLGFELYAGLMRRCECPPPNIGAATGGDEVSGMDWCSLTSPGQAVSCDAGVDYSSTDLCFGFNATDLVPIQNPDARAGCEARGYLWQNSPVGSFDDVITAAITLFKASTSGPTDLLYVAMDAASTPGELPSRSNNASAAVFLTIFHTIFTMFLLNIFIGVMSSTFSIQTGKAVITEGEKRWSQCVKDVRGFRPTFSEEEQYRPDEDVLFYPHRLKVFHFATDIKFERMCIAMVLGNTVLLVLEHYPASHEFESRAAVINTVFIAWFTIEFLIKLAGFGVRNYFSNGWLVFDFIVVSITLAIRFQGQPSGTDLFKVARCFKIFLLAKRAHSLLDLMRIVANCLVSAANVLLVMMVVTYIYAIMGMKFYGDADLLPQTNFKDFQHSMQLLIQVVTGQSYGKLVGLLLEEGRDTGGPYSEYAALAYFISYYILSVFICANLFIVTVLDNFDVASRAGQIIGHDQFWGFTYAWGDLTVGAHALPVLTGSQGMDFVMQLRDVVKKKKAEQERLAVSVRVSNIPPELATVEQVKELFAKYGEIENVEIRMHEPTSSAYVTFEDKGTADVQAATADEITLGTDSDGEVNVLDVEPTRHGDFEAGVTSISLPNENRDDRGTLEVTVVRADGVPMEVQPYVKVTSVAKHLHHGGRNISKMTRAVVRSDVPVATGPPSILFLAPPGAQKHWYCRALAMQYKLVHIDVGVLLREQQAASGGDTSPTVNRPPPVEDDDEESDMDFGRLVSEKEFVPLIKEKMAEAEESNKGFILSGFPRTKKQAKMLKAMDAIPSTTIILDVDQPESRRGCRRRRIDPDTGRMYDLDHNAPSSDEVLGRLVSRPDDTRAEVIDTRLKRFHSNLKGVLSVVDPNGVRRLKVDNDPGMLGRTLEGVLGLMTDTAIEAAKAKAESVVDEDAPDPAEWDQDDRPLHFHVNEHSSAFEFAVYDAATFSSKPVGTVSVDLEEIRSMALEIDDAEVVWHADATEALDGLLTLDSLDPRNAVATLGKTVKASAQVTKTVLKETVNTAQWALEEGVKAAEVIGLKKESAPDGALTHELHLLGDDGQQSCALKVQLRYHTKEWVPDWSFTNEFGEDNPTLKPLSCGIEGWMERKSGKGYEPAWMYITKEPPQLCLIDVASEQELRTVMKGQKGVVPPELIKRYDPHEIHRLRNGFSRVRNKRQHSAQEQDCLFQFSTVNEIDHNKVGAHDGSQSPLRRKGVLHVRVVEARGLPHMDRKGDTDAFVSLEFEEVTQKTGVVDDTIEPKWDEAFSFSVFDKESRLVGTVWDEDPHSSDDYIGTFDIPISAMEEMDEQDMWVDLEAVSGYKAPPQKSWSGGSLGEVHLILKWADAENAEVLLQQWIEDDINSNRLRIKENVLRFRTESPEVKYTWLTAIAWVEGACRGPIPPFIAPPAICDHDLKKLENDPSIVDLPISKARHLLYNLREFGCLGLQQGRNDCMYATFQLELYAWKTDYGANDGKRRRSQVGAPVNTFHGLDYYKTLERLCLLKYGKASSLPYAVMMEEYQSELANVALHLIQTACLAFLFRRRGNYNGTETRRRIHRMWRKDHKEDGEIMSVFFSAVNGIRNARFAALHRLRKLVQQNNPDRHHGKWDDEKAKEKKKDADEDSLEGESLGCLRRRRNRSSERELIDSDDEDDEYKFDNPMMRGDDESSDEETPTPTATPAAAPKRVFHLGDVGRKVRAQNRAVRVMRELTVDQSIAMTKFLYDHDSDAEEQEPDDDDEQPAAAASSAEPHPFDGSSAEEDDEEHEAHFQELVNLTHTDAELKVAAHKKKMEVDTEIEEDAYDDKVEEIVDMLEDLRPPARVALATDEGATKQEIQMAEDEEDPLEGLAKLILRLRDGDDARSPPPSGSGRPNRFQADSDDDDI